MTPESKLHSLFKQPPLHLQKWFFFLSSPLYRCKNGLLNSDELLGYSSGGMEGGREGGGKEGCTRISVLSLLFLSLSISLSLSLSLPPLPSAKSLLRDSESPSHVLDRVSFPRSQGRVSFPRRLPKAESPSLGDSTSLFPTLRVSFPLYPRYTRHGLTCLGTKLNQTKLNEPRLN
jgi:hypothetical protein